MFGPVEHAFILVAALGIDALAGDPEKVWRRTGHPVVWAGKAIEALERVLNRRRLSRNYRLTGGFFSVFILIGGAAGLGFAIEWLLVQHWAGYIALAVIASVFIAQRGLYSHVFAVVQAFDAGGIDAARLAVACIVGRDPQKLDEAGVCRAAIESCAENFSDAVVAPAFWFLLAGLPGLLAYKVLNTADSMIGYRSDRFAAFGFAAARLDDAANFIPARLTGLLIGLAAPFSAAAFRAMFEDARKHRSPNAGWPEAAMAGALGLALAGPRIYDGETLADSWMNGGGMKNAGPDDIGRALALFVRSAALYAGLVFAAAMLARL